MKTLSLKLCYLISIFVAVILSSCEYKIIYPENSKPVLRHIALTFDDGPDPVYTGMILDVLKEKEVKATFFLIGNKMNQYPEVTKRIFSEGHILANHSFDHMRLSGMPFNLVYKDIMQTENIITKICGSSLKLFRPPFGTLTNEQTDSLHKYGFKVVMWDFPFTNYNIDEMIEYIISVECDNQIILLHSADYSGKESRMHIVLGLPKIIDKLRSQGYVFIKVNELDSTTTISKNRKHLIQE